MSQRLPLRNLLITGLLASVVMGMFEMMAEAVVGDEGFWAPVLYIGATVLRDYQSVAHHPDFAAAPVLLGLVGHMMNSVVLGIGFAALLRDRIRGLVPWLGLGMFFGAGVFLIMWYGVLPAIDEVMLRLSLGAFLVAHLMWGAAIGVFNHLADKRAA